jgi:hypothetical protein
MFDLQHEVEALGKQMDALEKIADKNDWELIDDPIFSKDKIRDVLKECGIMNIETDIIKMLEDHSANRTYASDIETAMQYNGYSEREAVNGIKKLISDGKVTSDGVKIKLVK